MAKCHHDFAAQMEAIDDGGCPLCLTDAAATLERRVEEALRGNTDVVQHVLLEKWGLESRLAHLNEARAMAEALVLSHEGHIAELEQRVEVGYQMVAKAESDVATLSKRVARLEEEKAQALVAARDNLDHLTRVVQVLQHHQPSGSPPPGDAARLAEWILAQAQAREAAMREALVDCRVFGTKDDPCFMSCRAHTWSNEHLPTCAAKRAALSLDADHAPIDGSGIAPVPPVSLPGGKTPDSKTLGEYLALAAEVEALREVAKAAKAFLYAEQSVANYNKDNEARGWTLGPPAPPPVREKQRLRAALDAAREVK